MSRDTNVKSHSVMLFQVLLVLCFILAIICFNKKKTYWKDRGIIQEDGILWKFMFGNRSMPEYCKEIYDKYNEDQIGMYLGSMPALMVKNHDDIQSVLAGDFQSFYKRGLVVNKTDLLCDNVLIIDEYPRWKILRHKLTPAFTRLRLKTMFYSINKCAQDFVNLIENDASFRAKPYNILYTYTVASIGAAVFGIDTRCKNTLDSPFVAMAWKSLTPTFFNNMRFIINTMFPTLYKILQLKFFGDHEEFFIGAVKKVFESRRKGEKRNDFIDLCLELQKIGTMKDPITGYELEPTDELLAAQAFFFFIAGAETTANAIHFTLLELANSPKILATLHENIYEALKHGKTELDYDDLDKLRYLDMVVNEAMRKYPPIGQIHRLCTKDTYLPSNSVKIEQGTLILLPVYAMHRDATVFPNPDVFDPERFSPNNVKNMGNYSYLAFGGGNRICIGMRFARLQIKACLARLLRRFTLAEQLYKPDHLERSFFGLRDSDARYDFIPRNV